MTRPILLCLAACLLSLPAAAEDKPHAAPTKPHAHDKHAAPRHEGHAKAPAKPVPHPAPKPDKAEDDGATDEPAAPVAAPTAPAVDRTKGSNTGLPLPRFVALRSDDVDMRVGPGRRYPILWVYKRRDLPVEILREFDAWRLIRTQDGTKGWVHQATLNGRRTVVAVGDQTIRADAAETGGAVAVLKNGAIARLKACDAAASWCQVQAKDYRGWLQRTGIWGVEPNEAVQ